MQQHELQEGDEEGFILYEEQMVYQIQSLWHAKEGLENKTVLEISAKLEDLMYQQTLKNFSVSATANIWAKKEYLLFYQEITRKFVNNLKSKQMNWKKLFEEHEKNPHNILKQIMKEEGKFKGPSNKEGKLKKELKTDIKTENDGFLVPESTGAHKPKSTASKGSKPLINKAAGKKKNNKEGKINTLSSSADDNTNLFAVADSAPFDDSLFGGEIDLLGEDELEMDELFGNSGGMSLNIDDKMWSL
jgi:hypothetical protein